MTAIVVTSLRPAPAMLSSSRARDAQHLLCTLWASRLAARHRTLARAATTSSFNPKEETELVSKAASREPILFPELFEPGTCAVLVGVDPDIHGALAVLSWQNGDPTTASSFSSSSSSGGSTSSGTCAQPPALDVLNVVVHDMPVDTWKLRNRNKRQLHPVAVLHIIQELAGASGTGAPGKEAMGQDGQDRRVVVGAVVEHTMPQHICGKYAWYGAGYSYGLLTGVLTSQGIAYHRVEASLWKKHMGLYRQGKEGSMALARQLFPQAENYLRRKKDHGRAEALLIAAWGMGVRMNGIKQVSHGVFEDPGLDEGESDAAPSSGGNAAGGRLSAIADVDESGITSNTAEAAAGGPVSPKKSQRRPRKKADEDIAGGDKASNGNCGAAANGSSSGGSSSFEEAAADGRAAPKRRQRRPLNKPDDGVAVAVEASNGSDEGAADSSSGSSSSSSSLLKVAAGSPSSPRKKQRGPRKKAAAAEEEDEARAEPSYKTDEAAAEASRQGNNGSAGEAAATAEGASTKRRQRRKAAATGGTET